MEGLITVVLWAKIAITLLCWALPAIVAPQSWLDHVFGPGAISVVFTRITGFAFLALVVGYFGGLQELRSGQFPCRTVVMGLVSNGGATAAILLALMRGWLDPMPGLGRWSLIGSSIVTAGVTLGLAVSGATARASGIC